MSDSIEIKVDVEISRVCCNACGGKVGFSVFLDNYGGIQIDVDKCECDRE